MSTVIVTIETDNAAFEDPHELPRILNELAVRITYDGAIIDGDVTLRDVNGDVVGTAVQR